MRGFLEELWARARGRERRCEPSTRFAKPYPSLDDRDGDGRAARGRRPQLQDWSNLIQRQFGMSVVEERAAIEQAVTEFYAYAGELLDRRRARSRRRPHLDADRRRSRRATGSPTSSCVNLVLNVLVGGVDTTQSQLAHALRLFADAPGAVGAAGRAARAGAAAVEEVLRFEPITPFTARIAMEDVDVPRRDLPRGHGRARLRVHRQPRRAASPTASTSPPSAAGASRSPSAPASTTAWARTSRAPSCRRRSPSSPPRMPGLALDGEPRARHDRRHLRPRRAAHPLGVICKKSCSEQGFRLVERRPPNRRAPGGGERGNRSG